MSSTLIHHRTGDCRVLSKTSVCTLQKIEERPYGAEKDLPHISVRERRRLEIRVSRNIVRFRTPNVEIGNPPVFKGTRDVWCPEDLLIGALNACLMLTFLYQMQRRQLEVVAYESSAQGTLEHHDGKHRVTRILVQPRISLKSGDDVEAAREAIKDTVDACMISNSILAAVQVDPQFNALLKPAR